MGVWGFQNILVVIIWLLGGQTRMVFFWLCPVQFLLSAMNSSNFPFRQSVFVPFVSISSVRFHHFVRRSQSPCSPSFSFCWPTSSLRLSLTLRPSFEVESRSNAVYSVCLAVSRRCCRTMNWEGKPSQYKSAAIRITLFSSLSRFVTLARASREEPMPGTVPRNREPSNSNARPGHLLSDLEQSYLLTELYC